MSERVSPPIQEHIAPEKDSIESLDGLFYQLGKITLPSRSSAQAGTTPEIRRPLSVLRKRAELFEQFQATPRYDKEGRQAILAEARARDLLATNFLNQSDITVNIPGFGEQSARFNRLEPISGIEREEGLPPIVIIPGISNDLGSIAPIAQEIALRGREVISIGYPEGFMGTMTDAFVEEIARYKSFRPHADFFSAAVNHLTSGTEIDLWGLSTGCAVTGYLLQEEAFQNQVRNAVLFAPAASVDQSKVKMGMGVVREMGALVGNIDVLPHTVITTGRKEQEDADQLRRRKVVFKALQDAVSKNCGVWDEMKVKEGGEITYVVGGKDQITKCYLAVDEFKQNPQADVIVLPNAGHQMTMMGPHIIDRVFARQRKPQ